MISELDVLLAFYYSSVKFTNFSDYQFRLESGIPITNRFTFLVDQPSIDQEIALLD